MVNKWKVIEDDVFLGIEQAMQVIADRIDELESLDDFQLVELYTEIEDLSTRTSFSEVVRGMFRLAGDGYDPTPDAARAQVRRYDSLTKHHPTNAYRRFRKIADDMDRKWTAVDAVLKDRKMRAVASARVMLANSPKQAAKVKAHKLWQDWRSGKTLHKSGASFARSVTRSLPTIESEKTVQRWMKLWAADATKEA